MAHRNIVNGGGGGGGNPDSCADKFNMDGTFAEVMFKIRTKSINPFLSLNYHCCIR